MRLILELLQVALDVMLQNGASQVFQEVDVSGPISWLGKLRNDPQVVSFWNSSISRYAGQMILKRHTELCEVSMSLYSQT